MMGEGFIYVVEDLPDICKIGYTTKCPDQRVCQISCKYHKKFLIKGCIGSSDVRKEERLIHDFFQDYRISGEWFNLSYGKIKEEIKNLHIYFEDFENFKLRYDFINKAYWHWNEKMGCYTSRNG